MGSCRHPVCLLVLRSTSLCWGNTHSLSKSNGCRSEFPSSIVVLATLNGGLLRCFPIKMFSPQDVLSKIERKPWSRSWTVYKMVTTRPCGCRWPQTRFGRHSCWAWRRSNVILSREYRAPVMVFDDPDPLKSCITMARTSAVCCERRKCPRLLSEFARKSRPT